MVLNRVEKEREWTSLAEAIILQAVEDYRNALKTLRRQPDHQTAAKIAAHVLRFLRSEWFNTLSGMDSETLIRKLKEEAIE